MSEVALVVLEEAPFEQAVAPIVARPPFVEGVFYGMPAEDYRRIEGMSASGAKKMLRSPAHYKLMREQPSKPTAAMQLGTAIHCGVLEPAYYAERVVCAPEINKRTKDGREEWSAFAAANHGRLILQPEEFTACQRAVDAVNSHPAARRLLEGAHVEVSLFWNDGKYKVPCKARYDVWNHGGVTDLKSCADASPEAFGRAAANLLYHVQSAFYFSGAEHILNVTPEFFAFICVETEPPHGVACYVLPSNAILAGARLMNIALERYAAALAAGEWPGYPETIDVLPFPKWAVTFPV